MSDAGYSEGKTEWSLCPVADPVNMNKIPRVGVTNFFLIATGADPHFYGKLILIAIPWDENNTILCILFRDGNHE